MLIRQWLFHNALFHMYLQVHGLQSTERSLQGKGERLQPKGCKGRGDKGKGVIQFV